METLHAWGSLLGSKRERETRLDGIIVYATAEEKGTFTQNEMLDILERLGESVSGEELDRALKRLELAFVLGREKSTYTYQVPLFRDMVLEDGCGAMLRAECRSERKR